MASCIVNRNAQGRITEVLTPQGVPSKLFENIHSNIFLAGSEYSEKLTSAVYKDDIQNLFKDATNHVYPETGEPKVYYRTTKGETFDNLEEAIINNSETGSLDMGFINPKTEEFMNLTTLPIQSSPLAKLLNKEVLEGTISAERVLGEDGITRFKGKGNHNTVQRVAGHIAKLNLFSEGVANVKVNSDGTIEIPFQSNVHVAEKEDGTFDLVTLEELSKSDIPYTNKTELMAMYHEENEVIRALDNVSKSKPDVNVIDTINRLYNFLEGIGFTKTTLEEYRKKFKTKYGQDPDINALADIANKVVALSNASVNPGELSEEQAKKLLTELSEEIAHIAVEAYSDQNSIIEALVNVHYSPEYATHAEYYRKKYSEVYEESEVEDIVRKEILGKILAKEIANGFTTRTESEARQTLLDKLKQIWTRFISFFRGRVTPSQMETLNTLNKKIADSVLRNQQKDFARDLQDVKTFYYNAMDPKSRKIEATLKTARKAIEDLFKELRERAPRANELERISSKMDEIEVIRGVNTIAGIAASQMAVLESNAKEADKKGELLSTRDRALHNSLREKLVPILNSLDLELDRLQKAGEISDNNKETVKQIRESITDIGIRLNKVQPIIDNDVNASVNRQFDDMYGDAPGMTQEQKDIERAKLEGNIRDSSIMAKMFGLATESENPLLKMIAYKVTQINAIVNSIFRPELNKVVDNVVKNDLQKHESKITRTDENGKPTHYYKGFFNWAKFDKAKEDFQLQWIAQRLGKDVEAIRKLRKTQRFSEIITEEEDYKEFRAESKKWVEKNTQRRYKEKYYQDREERFNKHGIADMSRETLTNFNIRSFEVYRNHQNKDGTIDKSKLTDGEKRILADIRKEKDIVRSPYDNFGNVREGLEIIKWSDLSASEKAKLQSKLTYKIDPEYAGNIVVLSNNTTLDQLSDEARIALDLNTLSMVYREELAEGGKKTPTQGFIDKIRELEKAGGSAYEWVSSNATISLSDKYFENLDTAENFTDVATEYMNSLEDDAERDALRNKLEQYKKLNVTRKNLLRRSKNMNNPIEIDVYNMDSKLRQEILRLDHDISKLRTDMKLPKELFREGKGATVRELNEDFKKMMEDSGLSLYDFALQHMTSDKKRETEDFAYDITALFDGGKATIQKRYEKFLLQAIEEGAVNIVQENGVITNKEEVINDLKNAYAKRNVGSYFFRYAPEGYADIIEELKSGNISLEDVMLRKSSLEGKYPALASIEITPDYSWLDDISNQENVNPDYKKAAFYIQPSDEYLDKDGFFDYYGISMDEYRKLEDDDLGKLTATKNTEEFEMLKEMIRLKELTLEAYGDTNQQNKFLKPQISSSSFEKMTRLNASNVKDFIKDVVNNRPDEKIHGEQIEGVDLIQEGSDINIRVIPKYYQSKIEPGEITKNVLSAALADYHQALLYKERKAAEQDILALEEKVSKQKLLGNGMNQYKQRITKTGQVTNYYLRTKEYVDHQLYGVQQTRSFVVTPFGYPIDIMRMANKVQGFAKFANLGYNIFVDITGATTGIINNIIDRYAGTYYSKSSINRANSKVMGLVPKYMAEAGSLSKESELSIAMETFDVVETSERAEESASGRLGRMAKRSPYYFSEMSNLTVIPKILFGVMYDYRYYEGGYRSFIDFQTMQKAAGVREKATIKAMWENLEKESFYDHIILEDKQYKPSERFKELFPEKTEEEFQKMVTRIKAKTKQIAQRIDGVLNETNQVAAQRDAAMNFVMMHRGWLPINLTRKFKKAGYNLETGQYEEGELRVVARFIRNFRKGIKENGSFRAYAATLSAHEKGALRKTAGEFGALVALYAIVAVGLDGGDDEEGDDTWFQGLGKLIALRTYSEMFSQTAFGIPNTFIEVLQSPITISRTIEAPYKALDKVFDGQYQDALEVVAKQTLWRRTDQYGNLKQQISSFKHFNDPTLPFIE